MSLVLRGSSRVVAAGLLFVAIGMLFPSQAAAIQFQIERVSNQKAIVTVVPSQQGFDMSADYPTYNFTCSGPNYTGNRYSVAFPSGWRTTLFLLELPFDATTNSNGSGSVSSYGSTINTLEEDETLESISNNNALSTILLNAYGEGFGSMGSPWVIPPSLEMKFTTPSLPVAGTAFGSVDVTLANGSTWGNIGNSGNVCCGYLAQNTTSWSPSDQEIGPVVGTYQIVAVPTPEPSTLALLARA